MGPISAITRFVRQETAGSTPCTHGGRIAESGREDALDFSANLNPEGIPEVKTSARSAETIEEKLKHYPDNRYLRLRGAFANFVENYRHSGTPEHTQKITAENIIPTNGSSELIRLFAETLIQRGDRVIIPAPTFGEYAFQCQLFGANVQYCDYSQILGLTTTEISDASAVFLCNPNNPTGSMISQSDVLQLADRCFDHETFLFIDEAFIELADPTQSIVHTVFDSDFVLVLRSLTKVFAVPGLRIGFGIASRELAELLNRVRLVWNIGAPTEVIGMRLMDACMKSDYLKRSSDLIRTEREYLTKGLVNRGFTPLKSSVNFILVDITNTNMDSQELTLKMLEQGILIRDCASFKNLSTKYVRLAVRTRQENRMLLQAVDAVLRESSEQ
ncbi:MAG: histidinol-phosphate aminotransferase family protein [Methanosarcinales archaeon]|nr:MAG: histidinol-phosphate aminotransferase family protein [Methanosarcinales archaeon]